MRLKVGLNSARLAQIAASRETAGASAAYDMMRGDTTVCRASAKRETSMRPIRAVLLAVILLLPSAALAGDAEIKAAQGTIEAQLKAFQAGDGELAYSYAAPSIKRIFPTAEIFMGMVESAYQPVRQPRSFSFGKVQEMGANSIVQQVLLTGPDGKEYEAVYTLELQPDGVYRITGVSLKASNALST
jgi:hypothetical protein